MKTLNMEIALAFLTILLLMASGVPGNLAERCEQQHWESCPKEDISPLGGEPELNDHQTSILQQLCNAGYAHTESFQFAVLNIHDDSSKNKVEWKSGNSNNVMCDAKWKVDEPKSKETGDGSYSSYRHGLPMWPILSQHFSHKRGRIARRPSQFKPNFPNYAIATPVDMTEDVCENWMKYRMSDYDSKIFIDRFMKMFLNKDETECLNPIENLECYTKWLGPLVHNSLLSMIKSDKKLNGKRCPSELYVFFRNDPPGRFADHLKSDLILILAEAKCPNTTPVFGFLE